MKIFFWNIKRGREKVLSAHLQEWEDEDLFEARKHEIIY